MGLGRKIMATSGQHRADMHRLATDRKKHGLPSWAETIDVAVFFNNNEPFEKNRDGIVAAIKASRWFKDRADDFAFTDIIDGLEQSEDAEEFDQYWDDLYYEADYDRVWLNPFKK